MGLKLLWHEPSNVISVCELNSAGLPLLTILDDEYAGINPFIAYPLDFLKMFGWVILGEL